MPTKDALNKGMRIDEVVYADTGVEFPEMVAHIAKLEADTGIDITRLKDPLGFQYYMLDHIKVRGKNKGKKGYGWPVMYTGRWCTATLKTRHIKSYLDGIREKYNVLEYVGIAADEAHRVREKVYPLVDWGVTEDQALEYCRSKGYDWGGLYDKFHRVSCWCCPFSRIGELRVLYNEYPDLWSKLEYLDARSFNRFRPDYSVADLARRFESEKGRRNGANK